MELNTGTKQLAQFILDDWKLLLCLTILFALYFHYTSTFDFFEKKGIKFMKPTIIVGNIGSRILARTSFHAFQLEIYNNFKGHPYGGIFEGRRPVLYLIDPDIIKAVTIRDFDYFMDRLAFMSNAPKYISRSLLNLKGAEWKSVRSTITPSFSSSRLKHMLPLIQSCSDQMVKFLKQYENKDIEMKDIMGHFTLEVIGTCAFGIKSDALTDENAKFVKVAEKFNYIPAHKRFFLFFLLMFMPKMIRYLNISFLHHETTKKLVEMLQVTKAERRSTARKNDFLQLMIDAAEKEKEMCENSNEKPHLDDDTIDAQSLLFLIAGYETSSTLLSFAIHTLAVQPEIQEKLREHIVDVTTGKEMSYELLSQLDYLEAFLLETLRLYPPVARVDRVATKPYTLPGTSIKIDVGDTVSIPVYGIHMDPDHYPEPEVFKPDRFMKDGKVERPSHLFLAFGAGPRNCIGLRFAMFSAKLAMVSLLKNFKFTSCPKTEQPIQFHKSSMLLKAKTGLWVHVEKI
ncbi:cytochrome P450 9e2-like isoform X2 [Leptidea sinapis]|uniref:cytochrome P450 9e2-like isoform X2 n=1 Tax=Leptidea sinapis TaxID=189913 RepID=UPI00213B5408|nr:cytochrome P450 9e2-like isoform X2 [Leptidea sinapis]